MNSGAGCAGQSVQREPAVYILASGRNGTLYVGVTSDLIKRMHEHTKDVVDGFSKKYQVHSLVHFERHETMESAIVREKQLKKWNRLWKMRLIEENNPLWEDLWPSLLGLDARLRGHDGEKPSMGASPREGGGGNDGAKC